jgi:lysophospholipase L1-like esterase
MIKRSVSCPNILKFINGKQTIICETCSGLKQQLQITNSELKTANKVISLLSEVLTEITHLNLTSTNNKPLPSESTYIQVNNIRNLDDNMNHDEDEIANRDIHSPVSSLLEIPSTQNRTGSKIPTIINGKIIYNGPKKALTKTSITRRLRQRTIMHQLVKHKIKVISDSHLKDLALMISGYVNSEYNVTGYVKPGASVKQLANTMENELQCLDQNDAIIFCGGSNDIYNQRGKKKEIVSEIWKILNKYKNTNIILVMIPYRLDQSILSRTNSFIKEFNMKLVELAKEHKHVSTIAMSSERNHFTKHGLHMNPFGKEKLANRIVTHIRERLNEIVSSTPTMPLNYNLNGFLHPQTQNCHQDSTTQLSEFLHRDALTVGSHSSIILNKLQSDVQPILDRDILDPLYLTALSPSPSLALINGSTPIVPIEDDAQGDLLHPQTLKNDQDIFTLRTDVVHNDTLIVESHSPITLDNLQSDKILLSDKDIIDPSSEITSSLSWAQNSTRKIDNIASHRASTRNRKPPSTKTDDFLWN